MGVTLYVQAFMQLYSEILESGGPVYGEILKHIRDKPQEGCLFHCTAGKDRTGLIAAILLDVSISIPVLPLGLVTHTFG